MKILFPIGSFYPAQVGGPSNTIYWLSKALRKIDFEVCVITTSKGINPVNNQTDKWKSLHGIKVIYHTYQYWQFPIGFLKSVLKNIRSHDIIVLSSFFYLPSIITALFSVLWRKPLLISPRGEFSDSAIKYKSFSKFLRLYFVRFIIGKYLIFHSTSNQESTDIKKFFPKNKILEIPNYIEIPELKLSPAKEQFLFLGRLHSIKAIENIIEALGLSRIFKDSSYQFIIAGKEAEAGYKKVLIKKINDYQLTHKIRFVGQVEGEEKQCLMAESKFLFLLSNSENFGNVVVEALAQKTPVLASQGTPWKILEEYGAGFWINNSSETIRNKIEEIINMENNFHDQMRENALKLLTEKFDIHNNIRNWRNAFEYIEEKNK